MTTVTHTVGDAVEHASTSDYLEALRYFNYSITIQSPMTSPNGKHMVCAYGPGGAGPEMIRESREHLHDAIKAAALHLYGHRLAAFLRTRGGAR
ncbi:hypothetical protein AB0J63_26850 [Streptosporangium canum]|uniref:hypothetical protein n=1 Tax=Streptosporangium canum TaxID=324952 RepID=UPI0034498EAD